MMQEIMGCLVLLVPEEEYVMLTYIIEHWLLGQDILLGDFQLMQTEVRIGQVARNHILYKVVVQI